MSIIIKDRYLMKLNIDGTKAINIYLYIKWFLKKKSK
jgi:hypothetical protein